MMKPRMYYVANNLNFIFYKDTIVRVLFARIFVSRDYLITR